MYLALSIVFTVRYYGILSHVVYQSNRHDYSVLFSHFDDFCSSNWKSILDAMKQYLLQKLNAIFNLSYNYHRWRCLCCHNTLIMGLINGIIFIFVYWHAKKQYLHYMTKNLTYLDRSKKLCEVFFNKIKTTFYTKD